MPSPDDNIHVDELHGAVVLGAGSGGQYNRLHESNIAVGKLMCRGSDEQCG